MSTKAPWDPRKSETTEQVALFGAYLSTPPGTSVIQFATENGYSHSTVQALAARHDWRARKAAFHHALLREQLDAAKDAARARGEAQANFLGDLGELAHKAILDALTSGKKVALKDAIAAGKLWIEMSRLIHGESTQNVKIEYEGTLDEMEQARALLLKMRPKDSEDA